SSDIAMFVTPNLTGNLYIKRRTIFSLKQGLVIRDFSLAFHQTLPSAPVFRSHPEVLFEFTGQKLFGHIVAKHFYESVIAINELTFTGRYEKTFSCDHEKLLIAALQSIQSVLNFFHSHINDRKEFSLRHRYL